MKTSLAGLALCLAIASTAAPAMQLDKLGGLMGGAGGGLSSGSASNAAGIIQYCVNNNYLGGSSGATGVKDKLLGSLSGDQNAANTDAGGSSAGGLLGKFGGKSKKGTATTSADPTKDKGYLDGAKGLLTTGDGKTVNLTGGDSGNSGDMKGQLVHKACDAVLKQGKKLVGM
ncbi:DUF2501 domain-containing protein [Luteibacter yeojuensis]|uniref:DUF2501 domain-containing protein n=1 Tax=Luteibacter yeojuensis TaxID=345309 RepID=A0A0F3KQ59_9GAMM|nr:DUF2501 domain-containing protein [Luteibacter yeojuensis]KJV33353.1 hypothetical protein VI08_11295 [Luteibacter yeojuensis]